MSDTRWRRVLAVGCSHGIYADPVALAAVLRFKRLWKPDVTIHLGDAIDATALRSGARGTPDESKPIAPDIDGGIDFLNALRPNVFLWGNHEDRLRRLCECSNAIVADCAWRLTVMLNDACKSIGCAVYPYKGIYQNYPLGGVRFMHGVMFNEQACRDHAEAFGPCVFAHTHRAGVATGRRSDRPKGYCVGTLTRMENMDYASTRRSTLSWSQGFVWGEFKGDQSQLWLHEQPDNSHEWRLPI